MLFYENFMSKSFFLMGIYYICGVKFVAIHKTHPVNMLFERKNILTY